MILSLQHFKKHLLAGVLSLGFVNSINSQCLSLNCSPSFTVPALTGTCGAVVNYSTAVVTGTCMSVGTQTFVYTGAAQTFTVPAGVTTMTMETWGAQGGANWVNNTNFGGYAKGTFTVTPGEVLGIYVGGQATTIAGGFNGGGTGEGAGKGGGGGTDVRQGGMAYSNRIIVAGGGGGAGYWSSLHVVGGVGGGLVGGDGYRDPNYATSAGGQGGTQTSSGYGTCINYSVTAMGGGFGFGGSTNACGCEGYGGGGGWYGGAASGNCRGGGGGSGYLSASATNTAFASGTNVGNGKVVLQYGAMPTATLVSGLASGSGFPLGTTVQTYSVVDSFSNTATCSFSITVVDTQSPTISCPANVVQCTPVVSSITALGVSDNCGAPSVTYSLSGVTTGTGTTNASGTTFNTGVTNVTYMAMDGAGNVSSCSFSVTISTCAGVETFVAANYNVSVYPNPNNGEFVIKTASANEKMTVEIYNVLGELVQTEKVNTEITNIKLNAKPGAYIVKITENNQLIYRTNIIKQ